MFDASARQQHDVGRRVAGHGVGDFLKFRQGPGQLEQDQGGPLQQAGAQREVFEAGADRQGLGVRPQRPFTGDEVMVDPDGVPAPSVSAPSVRAPYRSPTTARRAPGFSMPAASISRALSSRSLSVASQACRLAASTSGNLLSRAKRVSKLVSATRVVPPFLFGPG